MTYIMSCVWLDYMVKYFQCKNCVGSSPKTKKCVASFLVPGDITKTPLRLEFMKLRFNGAFILHILHISILQYYYFFDII